ncbi:MAG TPA: energy transducer TonB [Alphaproteobacteria bacterium]|nr:energy transducer TonB [Alphaproteobacteria bacterium]
MAVSSRHKLSMDRGVFLSLSISVVFHAVLILGLSGFIGNWGMHEFSSDEVISPQPEVWVELMSSIEEIVPDEEKSTDNQTVEPNIRLDVVEQDKPASVKQSDAMTKRGLGGVESYAARVVSQINAFKFYPKSAIRRHEEGDVVLSFVLERDGAAQDIRIVKTSYSHSLDRAAVDAVKRASPFDVPPESFRDADLHFTVPMRYQLHRQ